MNRFIRPGPRLAALSACGLLAAGPVAGASYSVTDTSLATPTYTATGPSNPAAPGSPWATVILPMPTVTAFDSSLGTLVSSSTELAPYLVVTAQGTFFADSVSGDPEATFAIWIEAIYTNIWDELGDVEIGGSQGACQAAAPGSFTCGESDVAAVAGTFVGLQPPQWPASSTFRLYAPVFTVYPNSAGVSFSSLDIAATVGFVAVTTYEYTPAAQVPLPACGWLLAGAFALPGVVKRRSAS